MLSVGKCIIAFDSRVKNTIQLLIFIIKVVQVNCPIKKLHRV